MADAVAALSASALSAKCACKTCKFCKRVLTLRRPAATGLRMNGAHFAASKSPGKRPSLVFGPVRRPRVPRRQTATRLHADDGRPPNRLIAGPFSSWTGSFIMHATVKGARHEPQADSPRVVSCRYGRMRVLGMRPGATVSSVTRCRGAGLLLRLHETVPEFAVVVVIHSAGMSCTGSFLAQPLHF
jgi:hypothetical protein